MELKWRTIVTRFCSLSFCRQCAAPQVYHSQVGNRDIRETVPNKLCASDVSGRACLVTSRRPLYALLISQRAGERAQVSLTVRQWFGSLLQRRGKEYNPIAVPLELRDGRPGTLWRR